MIELETLCLQKQQSEARLYAVTDDDATVAYLLKTMRDMDPEGVGIVRSEFKKYTLTRMHSGNLRQNHRLWRRLQNKMQKLGVLELDVHTVSLCSYKYRGSVLAGAPAMAFAGHEDTAAVHTEQHFPFC